MCGGSGIPASDCDCNGNQLDALGICGGSCQADLDGDGICDDVDDCIGTFDACGVCNGPGAIYDCGCEGIPAGDCDCNGNQLDALGICGGSCEADSDGDGICDTDEIPGCTDNAACNYNEDATDEDGSCAELDECGVCGGSGIPASDCDCNGNQLDALGSCGGSCEADLDGDGICDTDEVPGCTDPQADNFEPSATDLDGSCTYSGCMDPSADNYSPLATTDNGLCAYTCVGATGCTYPSATNFDADADCDNGSCEFVLTVDDGCMFDVDGSGMIGASDLIIFLQYFESTCD